MTPIYDQKIAGLLYPHGDELRFQGDAIATVDMLSSSDDVYLEMSGTSDDVSWIKMEDGTLLQQSTQNKVAHVTSDTSTISNVKITFPIDFVGVYSATVNCNKYSDVNGYVGNVSNFAPLSLTADFHTKKSNLEGDVHASFIAIGRWK